MKLWTKIGLISAGIVLAAAAVIIYSIKEHGIREANIMDGDGMVYTWPTPISDPTNRPHVKTPRKTDPT